MDIDEKLGVGDRWKVEGRWVELTRSYGAWNHGAVGVGARCGEFYHRHDFEWWATTQPCVVSLLHPECAAIAEQLVAADMIDWEECWQTTSCGS